MKQFYLCLCFFFSLNIFYSQSSANNQAFFSKLDSIQGYKNLAILNGISYRENFRTINEKHPYFNGREFQLGSLVYDDEEFSNILLRYDIYQDILIATIKRSGEEVFIIELITDLVDSFSIGKHEFENLRSVEDGGDPGFYEVLYSYDCMKIYKKERTKPLDKRDRSVVYYEFEKLSTEYFISDSNSLLEPDLSDLKYRYPDQKDRLNDFFRSNRSQRRSNYEVFLRDLGNLIEEFDCKTKKNQS
ncbi:hypothetical protein ML462_03790 [Gramella lutea]|uniref:Secreted protein n=1 Tax=Christiangramia lutea TaxID=1607951 RepID=A0A9X1V1G1_9FLAO|nr:hypothetical protein [Christiangramia lutea]MCH4822286.1 hypothetical protein [Christiangramia lutea]